MSDIALVQTSEGLDIDIISGSPKTTSGIANAVCLSILIPTWWGNSESTIYERYSSGLTAVLQQTLTNNTRLDVIESIKTALSWMKQTGIATEITVDGEIVSTGRMHVRISITEPSGSEAVLNYALNWDSQEVELL